MLIGGGADINNIFIILNLIFIKYIFNGVILIFNILYYQNIILLINIINILLIKLKFKYKSNYWLFQFKLSNLFWYKIIYFK